MPEPSEPLGILLISGTYEHAHYAFMLAAAAAAIGRRVTLFATNAGCHALCRDWSALEGADADATVQSRGVAGLEELRTACLDLDVALLACDTGLHLASVTVDRLLPSVEVTGIPAFLAHTGRGQTITL